MRSLHACGPLALYFVQGHTHMIRHRLQTCDELLERFDLSWLLDRHLDPLHHDLELLGAFECGNSPLEFP